MDVDRCITLHNEILRHGWIGHGNNPEQFEAECPTWTEHYGDTAEQIRPDLNTELYAFLSGARVIVESLDFLFYYWVRDLCSPGSLFNCEDFFPNFMDEDPDPKRIVVLFWMRDEYSHRLGVLFDQKTSLAIICPTLDEVEVVLNGRTPWYPLDRLLQAWLDMIANGSIKAVPDEQEAHGRPWVLDSCSEIMIQKTVNAFDRLVQSIEARLPDAGSLAGDTTITYGLLDDDVLQLAIESEIVEGQGFAFEFLRRARRPRFSRIAPGLDVPNSANFLLQQSSETEESMEGSPSVGTQLWKVVEGWYRNVLGRPQSASKDDSIKLPSLPALLLFRSNRVVDEKTINCRASGPYDRRRRGWGSRYNAGLYLIPLGCSRFEDEFQLILPFGIGAKGYARMSDGSRFCENTASRDPEMAMSNMDTFADLYRPGYQPFEDFREHRLFTLLENWRERVECGDWDIGEDGVEGSMEVWREADTEHGWQKYVLPVG
ncbi:uncharacterized protein EI97DRAFT_503825 [Westerdykella ornata]|uniref:Uncharacterized protein n=1 Tax=Westerdykella ornata TaxID=318751 RepID=A0A6A6J9H5_WESOR|nr:uncharacterized protein EI97DRAFT_503825 [Westerdykella ornata]KAF2273042.1 hypothetical protein EI97DRAFT_503825 [Westerdykella ornata]